MPKQRLDNIDFISELMGFSRYGALAQIFIMEAVRRYADEVAQAQPTELDSPMLSGQAWVGVAKEIKTQMDERLSCPS